MTRTALRVILADGTPVAGHIRYNSMISETGPQPKLEATNRLQPPIRELFRKQSHNIRPRCPGAVDIIVPPSRAPAYSSTITLLRQSNTSATNCPEYPPLTQWHPSPSATFRPSPSTTDMSCPQDGTIHLRLRRHLLSDGRFELHLGCREQTMM